jgi:hypothetical protein
MLPGGIAIVVHNGRRSDTQNVDVFHQTPHDNGNGEWG